MSVQRFGEYVFPQITFPETDQQTKLPREAPAGALKVNSSPWSILSFFLSSVFCFSPSSGVPRKLIFGIIQYKKSEPPKCTGLFLLDKWIEYSYDH